MGHRIVSNKFITIILSTLSIVSILFLISLFNVKKVYITIDPNDNAFLAGRIVDYYHKHGRLIDFRNIYQTLDAIDRFREDELDAGVFNKEDLIALAMLESDFNPRAVSSADAIGIWQITHITEYLEEVGGIKDPFDIYCNTLMCFRILNNKYSFFKNKKDAIIGYNGFVYGSDGKVIDIFYRRWKKCRDVVERLKGENYVVSVRERFNCR